MTQCEAIEWLVTEILLGELPPNCELIRVVVGLATIARHSGNGELCLDEGHYVKALYVREGGDSECARSKQPAWRRQILEQLRDIVSLDVSLQLQEIPFSSEGTAVEFLDCCWEARRIFEKQLLEVPGDLDFPHDWVRFLVRQGAYEEARWAIDRAMAEFSKDPETFSKAKRSAIFSAIGDPEGSLEMSAAALRSNHGDLHAQYLRALSLGLLWRLVEADEAVEEIRTEHRRTTEERFQRIQERKTHRIREREAQRVSKRNAPTSPRWWWTLWRW